MPELKNTFTGGKMDKDQDERILGNGLYREALNIEVATSEDSDVGAAQNILGNVQVTRAIAGPKQDYSSCSLTTWNDEEHARYYGTNQHITHVVDPQADKLYRFINTEPTSEMSHGVWMDRIVEYDTNSNIQGNWAAKEKAVMVDIYKVETNIIDIDSPPPPPSDDIRYNCIDGSCQPCGFGTAPACIGTEYNENTCGGNCTPSPPPPPSDSSCIANAGVVYTHDGRTTDKFNNVSTCSNPTFCHLASTGNVTNDTCHHVFAYVEPYPEDAFDYDPSTPYKIILLQIDPSHTSWNISANTYLKNLFDTNPPPIGTTWHVSSDALSFSGINFTLSGPWAPDYLTYMGTVPGRWELSGSSWAQHAPFNTQSGLLAQNVTGVSILNSPVISGTPKSPQSWNRLNGLWGSNLSLVSNVHPNDSNSVVYDFTTNQLPATLFDLSNWSSDIPGIGNYPIVPTQANYSSIGGNSGPIQGTNPFIL